MSLYICESSCCKYIPGTGISFHESNINISGTSKVLLGVIIFFAVMYCYIKVELGKSQMTEMQM